MSHISSTGTLFFLLLSLDASARASFPNRSMRDDICLQFPLGESTITYNRTWSSRCFANNFITFDGHSVGTACRIVQCARRRGAIEDYVTRYIGSLPRMYRPTHNSRSIHGFAGARRFDLRLTQRGYFRGYDSRVDATLSNSAASAGLFFVAALTPKTLDLVDSRSALKSGERSLLSAFYAPQEFYEAGAIDRLIVGATGQLKLLVCAVSKRQRDATLKTRGEDAHRRCVERFKGQCLLLLS